MEGLTEFPPPAALASLEDAAVVRWAATVTAQEARAVGINWVFAPVADLDVLPENPIVQTRAFGGDPNSVASYVRSWIEGCQDAGALACAKHYPGHGRTTVDSHIALPVVDASAADAARHRPAAVRRRRRERRRLGHDRPRRLSCAGSFRASGHALEAAPRRAARRARLRRIGRDRCADHGRRAAGTAGVRCGRRGGAAREWTCCCIPTIRGGCGTRSTRRSPAVRSPGSGWRIR